MILYVNSKTKQVLTHFSPEPGNTSLVCVLTLYIPPDLRIAGRDRHMGLPDGRCGAVLALASLFGDPDCGSSLAEPKPSWINDEIHQLSALVGCKRGDVITVMYSLTQLMCFIVFIITTQHMSGGFVQVDQSVAARNVRIDRLCFTSEVKLI